mgnify:CR=1 FL=1
MVFLFLFQPNRKRYKFRMIYSYSAITLQIFFGFRFVRLPENYCCCTVGEWFFLVTFITKIRRRPQSQRTKTTTTTTTKPKRHQTVMKILFIRFGLRFDSSHYHQTTSHKSKFFFSDQTDIIDQWFHLWKFKLIFFFFFKIFQIKPRKKRITLKIELLT